MEDPTVKNPLGFVAVLLLIATVPMWACNGRDVVNPAEPGSQSRPDLHVPTTTPGPVTLACDGGTFSVFRLKNTGARTYEPGGFAAGRSCMLTDEAEGVIWVATGEGHALDSAEQKLTFKDDQGRLLGHTCWTSSGTINDVTQTELILFGAADIKSVQVCCESACVYAIIEAATEGAGQ